MHLSKIGKRLKLISKILNLKFFLNKNFISYNQVFSNSGLLPGFFKRAEKLSNFCLNHRINLIYEKEKNSILGVKIFFSDKYKLNIVDLLMVIDTLMDFVDKNPLNKNIILDELLHDKI